jgi:hypothetical protein
MTSVTVRPATVDDVAAIASVHVRSWQEAYRGQMPDEILDELDPGDNASRRLSRMNDPANPSNTVVAVDDSTGAVIGFTEFGPSLRDDDWQHTTEDEG